MKFDPLRIVLLEDDPYDRALVAAKLEEAGISKELIQSANEESFRNALLFENPQLILSDLSLPAFSGLEALEIWRKSPSASVPFIFVTGTIGEERAVELMRAGATDVVMKTNLDTLVPAVDRAMREVEERRRRTETIRVQTERLKLVREFSNTVPIPFFVKGLDGRYLECNRSFALLVGTGIEEVLGKSTSEVAPPDSVAFDESTDQDVIETGREQRREFRVADASGRIRDVVYVKSPFRSREGTLVGVVGAILDVTDQKDAERAARRALELQEAVFNSLEDSVFVVDGRSRIIEKTNPAVERVFGFSGSEMIGSDTSIIHVDDERFNHFGIISRPVLERTGLFSTEFQFKRKDGSLFDAEVSVSSLSSTLTWRGRVVTIIRDISERKRAERMLLRRSREVETLVENAPDLIMRTDRNLTILFVNAVFESFTGYPSSSVIGKEFIELAEPLGLELRTIGEWNTAVAEVFEKHNPLSLDLEATINGRRAWLQSRVVPEFDESGAVVTAMSTTRNITAQVEAQQALERAKDDLRRSQRLESIGRLAGGVAHDFNNILTAISGYTQFAIEEVDPESRLGRYLTNIRANIDRAARLTRQLLLFSRKTPSEMTTIDLEEIVKGTLRMLDRLIGENVSLRYDSEGPVRTVHGDSSKIEQVIMNLVINARDAMPSGGRIHLALRNGVAPGKKPAVVLTVADTGSGMDGATLERIFEPFFTTKAREQGTGLGLAVVHGIIEEHGGTVSVDSRPGEGTTFTLSFPAQGERSDMHPPAPAPEGRHAGLGQTVLLVEDEADILLILSATLSRAGYAPTSASSVSAAVQAWQSAEPPFDAAIVDMVLPDGSGLDFLNAVSPTGSTRFIFVSGYLEDTRDFDAVRERGYHFVHKPYSIDLMTDLLRRALEKNGQDK